MKKNQHTLIERFFWIVIAGLVVFFARWRSVGLQPDAALYAGLSLKVLNAGQGWVVEGTKLFHKFFEHPPYFFMWGSWVLKIFGTSDGAARSIGGLFGFTSFIVLGMWTWARFGWSVAVITLFFVATTGQFTKYAASAMLEAPLSFGVMLVAIGAYELHWRERAGLRRPLWTALVYFGLMVATASKGLAGLGAWGGLVLSIVLAFFYSPRSSRRIFLSFFTLLFALIVALIPLGVWMYQTYRHDGSELILDYFFNQVLRSAMTNRGENGLHPVGGDKLYYLKVFLHYGWPWFWTFVLAWIALLFGRRSKNQPGQAHSVPTLAMATIPAPVNFSEVSGLSDYPFRAIAFNSLAFGLAFIVPFSLVHYQLPHYVHPIYLVALPAGAYLTARVLSVGRARSFLPIATSAKVRWAITLLAAILLVAMPGSRDLNRGQNFAAAAQALNRLPAPCVVVVAEDAMDAYRMESFSLWYWKGRKWDTTPKPYPSKISVPRGSVFWDPQTGDLYGRHECDPAR